jgi:hypothetical protein
MGSGSMCAVLCCAVWRGVVYHGVVLLLHSLTAACGCTVHLYAFLSPRRPNRCYTQEVTLHYYPYISRDAFTTATLLSEDLMRMAVRNFTARQTAVNAVGMTGLRCRLGEVGSLSGGWKAPT